MITESQLLCTAFAEMRAWAKKIAMLTCYDAHLRAF